MVHAFEILESDILNGLVYATQSLNFTFNRMAYKNDDLQRFRKIRDGIIIEQASERILIAEFNIPLISTPFKTDYRTTDSAELVVLTKSNRMLAVDVKGFRIFEEFNGVKRTPAMLEEQGWALIPVDQFENRPKPIYIFPFLLANDVASSYLFHVKVATTSSLVPTKLQPYSNALTVGISFLGTDGKTLSKVARIGSPFIAATKSDVAAVDCLFGFDALLKTQDLHIVDKNRHHFLAGKDGWTEGQLGVSNCSLVIGGWATDDDVRRWKVIPTGTASFPYFKTRNPNKGIEISKLRSMAALTDYLKSC